MTTNEVSFGPGPGGAFQGMLATGVYHLYPGQENPPTGTNPDQYENGSLATPRALLNLLSVRGRRFLPVEPGMWLGLFVRFSNGGQALITVTFEFYDGLAQFNLWRPREGREYPTDPMSCDSTNCWEVADYGAMMMGHRVDRSVRDAGGPNGGLFDPLVVDEGPFSGLHVLNARRITVHGRLLTLDGAVAKAGEGSARTSSYGPAETVLDLTLISRVTARGLLRAAHLVGADEEPVWSEPIR